MRKPLTYQQVKRVDEFHLEFVIAGTNLVARRMRMQVFWPGNWNSVFSRWESGVELPVFPTLVFIVIDVYPPILEKNRAISSSESQTYHFSLEPKAGLWKYEIIQLIPLYLIDWFDDLIFSNLTTKFFFRPINSQVGWLMSLLYWLLTLSLSDLTNPAPPKSDARVDRRPCSSFDDISCSDLTTSIIIPRPRLPLSFSDRQLHKVTDVLELCATIDQCRPDNLFSFFPHSSNYCKSWPTSVPFSQQPGSFFQPDKYPSPLFLSLFSWCKVST